MITNVDPRTQSSSDLKQHGPELQPRRFLTLDLGTRLARLQDPTLSYTIPQLEAMDVNELGAFQIDFGRKFVGKTFAEALEASPEWGKWCCDHLKDSPKQKHRALLIYIRKYVEQAEKIETELQASCPSDLPKVTKTSKATPKVKAGGKSKSSSVDEPWDVIEAEGSAVEDQVSALAGHVDQQVLALNGVWGKWSRSCNRCWEQSRSSMCLRNTRE